MLSWGNVFIILSSARFARKEAYLVPLANLNLGLNCSKIQRERILKRWSYKLSQGNYFPEKGKESFIKINTLVQRFFAALPFIHFHFFCELFFVNLISAKSSTALQQQAWWLAYFFRRRLKPRTWLISVLFFLLLRTNSVFLLSLYLSQ